GAVNVVMGNASEIGDSLLKSSQVKKITFTGSTAVGKKLMSSSPFFRIRIRAVMLPGYSHWDRLLDSGSVDLLIKHNCIFLPSAPPSYLADGFFVKPSSFLVQQPAVLWTCFVSKLQSKGVQFPSAAAIKPELSKFRNNGQTCVCANRIIVQEGIYEKFANVFVTPVKKLEVGCGFTESVSQVPLINDDVVQKVEYFLQDATSKGAKVLLGGKRHSLGMTFYEPTILGEVNNEMLIASGGVLSLCCKIIGVTLSLCCSPIFRKQDKLKTLIMFLNNLIWADGVFGPVAPLLRFKTEEEAIYIANNTNAGLAAHVFTINVQRSWRVSEALEFGIVGVKEGITSTEVSHLWEIYSHSKGRVKQSGLGREGSKYGMDEYLEVRYMCMGNMGGNA
ncbi:hypothetical protein C5167_039798, partial [Papaver somniferum]